MKWTNGFKRETIINIGDTLLFVKSFEVMTDKEASEDYERYMYPAKLPDMLPFRQDRLRKFTSNIEFEFQHEIVKQGVFRGNGTKEKLK